MASPELAKVKNPVVEENEEDKELQNELNMLVARITKLSFYNVPGSLPVICRYEPNLTAEALLRHLRKYSTCSPIIPRDGTKAQRLTLDLQGDDFKLISPAIEMLKYLIRTATTSMTSVPKPLKYLTPHYSSLKGKHAKMPGGAVKKSLADVISVLAMGTGGEGQDCLAYCLQGTMTNIGDWGHEYIRHLENQIVQQWIGCPDSEKILMPLVKDIISFNCGHHAEIQACDLLMEIDRLNMLTEYVNQSNYQRVCLYLSSCTKYVDDVERSKIMKLICQEYLKYGEFSRSLITAILMNDNNMVNTIFEKCDEKTTLYQMAFICARHLYTVDLNPNLEDVEELQSILSNSHLSSYFITLARELDIMEPKAPEDVYKTWLEPVPPRLSLLGDNVDSARQNLASSFVNGFVNAGFGSDKLLTTEGGNKWIYRNKDHGMLSATAALGLLHLWDVDGGLTPIDKYLYSTEDNIKAGALLALGIVNCRVRNECDPALALLGDYLQGNNSTLQIGAIFGIGLAYAGTARDDVLDLLLPIINSNTSPDVLGITCLSCGLITLGRSDNDVASTILDKIIESNNTDSLKTAHMRLAGLGVALCYFGMKGAIDAPCMAMEVFEEPFRTTMQCMLKMCAYAGTGDVLVIQELLRIVGDKLDMPEDELPRKSSDLKKKTDWDYCGGQATAALAVAAVSAGEDIGVEMVHRIFGHVGRYGETSVRKAAPLAIALTSVSNPQLTVIDILTKYSHDFDDDVSCNAIFSLGFIGAGTNNARLAMSLRQLAVYHAKNPSQLFMVRVAQGLVHMGKGTLTLNPLHTDRQLVDPVAMAGLLVTLIPLLDPHSTILSRSHYLLYSLVTAIQPRWLLTLDENLEAVPVTVRVGQAVDVVAKAGTPKTIAGIHTHSTPVLLAAGERAELATDQYQSFAPTMDGICVLKKVEGVE